MVEKLLTYEGLISHLKKKKYEEIADGEFIVFRDEDNEIDVVLVVRLGKDYKKDLNELKKELLESKGTTEGIKKQYGILFVDKYIIFLRKVMVGLTPKILVLKKSVDKISPAFKKKFEKLSKNFGNIEYWEKLFDRSDIIEEFYALYLKAREKLIKNINGLIDDKEKVEFADNLMMQLLIIWYLQEKEFLDGDDRYLIKKFKTYRDLGFNSYYEFLKELFKKMSGYDIKKPYYVDEKFGKVVITGPAPFLNEELRENVRISDDVFYVEGKTDLLKKIDPKNINVDDVPILNLFESRDWTEGNIDEFVLGAIFEKLMTAEERKEKGAYYTPEIITRYISENTIYPYLTDKINEKFETNYKSLKEFFEKEEDLEKYKYLYEVLQDIKILDPACGSGHFLETAIEVLVNIYEELRNRIKELGLNEKEFIIKVADENGEIKNENLLSIEDEDEFKLKVKFHIIISKNIYGVDIQKNAIKVARARMFLTLAKHFNPEKDVFIRFPNVHFNLREGNSLIGFVDFSGLKKVVESTQTTLDNFFNYTKNSKTEKTKSLDIKISNKEFKNYLSKLDKKLNLNLIGLLEDVKRIYNKELNENSIKKVLELKEKLIRVLLVSLNSKFVKDIKEILDNINDAFNEKLNDEFLDYLKENGIKITNNDLKDIRYFHWIMEFSEVFVRDSPGFDIVIGNPPWNAVKPVEKEFFSHYDPRLTKYGVDKQEAKRIINELLKNEKIKEKWERYKTKIKIESEIYRNSGIYQYQSDVVGGRRVGGDLNYYKLFLERSYQLLKSKGFLGIVVPSGIYTDAGTKGLRKLFFENGKTLELYCFENRKKIFQGIDIRFKFVIFINQKYGKTEKFYGAFMLHDVGVLNEMPKKAIIIDWNLVKKFSPDSWSIIEFKSQKDVDIVEKMYRHPILKENDWLGKVELYREFDMTNDSELFNKEKKGLRLYEGKMIEQYNPYFDEPTYWIEENIGKEKLYGKKTNKKKFDYKEYRLGFRAVASSTNRRSMIAAILPKNVFCGNSVIVTKIYDENDNRLISEDKLLYLCGVFNSFVFDYLLRLKITTNLNMFFIYQMPVPVADTNTFEKIVKNVVKLTENWDEYEILRKKYNIPSVKLNENERLEIIAEIDALVAKLYGLTKEELQLILDTFHHKDPNVEAEIRKLESLILQKFEKIT